MSIYEILTQTWACGMQANVNDYHPTVLPLNQHISEQTDEKSCLESQNNVGNVVGKNMVRNMSQCNKGNNYISDSPETRRTLKVEMKHSMYKG